MNEPEYRRGEDEIDLKELFNLFLNFLKRVLRAIFMIVAFYRRNFWRLLIFLVVGMGLGLLVDYFLASKTLSFKQEIVVHPNYNSTVYFYETLERIISGKKQNVDIGKPLGLSEWEWRNIVELDLTPIFDIDELILDKELFKNLDEIEKDKLTQPEFRTLYSKHTLSLIYKNDSLAKETSQKLLKFFSREDYFHEVRKVALENLTKRRTYNERSLSFIDSYLEKLTDSTSAETSDGGRGLLLFSEDGAQNMSGILDKKSEILAENEELALRASVNSEILRVISFGDLVPEKKSILDYRFVFLPLIILAIFSLYHLFKFMGRRLRRFAFNSDDK